MVDIIAMRADIAREAAADRSLVNEIARFLCTEAGEEWETAKGYWTGQADEVLAIVRDSDRRSRRAAA